MKQAQEALTQQIKEEEFREIERRLRWCFKHLAENESIPVLTVIAKLVKSRGDFPFEKFTQELESLLKFYLNNNFTDDPADSVG